MQLRVLLKSAAALVLAAAAAQAQTISNPSFEAQVFSVYPGYVADNGPIVGWTPGSLQGAGLNPLSDGQSPFANNGAIPNGSRVAFMQANTDLGSLSAAANGLVPGTTYRVDFRANARTGNSPTLTVGVDGVLVPWFFNGSGPQVLHPPIPPVGGTNPYHHASFFFTATQTTHLISLTVGGGAGDQTVLVDDFQIEAMNAWNQHPWTGDSSTGIEQGRTLWAYQFNTTLQSNINGVTVIGMPGVAPAFAGRFSVTGATGALADTNSLTALGGLGSGQMGQGFIYGGSPMTITLDNLAPGQAYRVSIFGVGYGSEDRSQTFSCDGDVRVFNETRYGSDKGTRIDYDFVAPASSRVLTIMPTGAATFHLYGLALRQTSRYRLQGFATETVECPEDYDDPGAANGPRMVGAGRETSIGLDDAGEVVGWSGGSLPLSDVVAVESGDGNYMALKRDGTVQTWGPYISAVPPGLNNVVNISLAAYHAMALKRDGTVVVWGGNPNFGHTLQPPPGLNNVIAIDTGHYTCVALKNDGTVVGWDAGFFPSLDEVPPGITDVVAVEVSRHHIVVLTRWGTVAAWGGDGVIQNSPGGNRLAIPPGLDRVVQIAAGADYSAALRSNGTIAYWGHMFALPSSEPYVSLVGGYDHVLGIRADGVVRSSTFYNGGPQTAIPAELFRAVGQRTGTLDTHTLGSYPLDYTLKVPPNELTRSRTVVVEDTLPPAVTLNGADPLVLTDRTWVDPGATADDLCAGNTPVIVSGTVNPNFPGVYTLTYESTDPSGNTGSAQRQVAVALPSSVPGDGDGDGEVSEAELAAVIATLADEQAFLNAAGYYTAGQVQDLHVDTPLISQVSPGLFRLTLGLRKSADLSTNPFSNFSFATPGTTLQINPEGKIEFEFPATDDAAFFRIETP